MGGNLKGKKIAYLFYDNPAGSEPLPILEDLQKIEGFELRTFAVPPPGVEMGAQVLDITQRYQPDFVIAHLFGRSPSVAIKEFKRERLSAVEGARPRLGLGRSQTSWRRAAWTVAEGYHTMQFAGRRRRLSRSVRKSRRCTRRRAKTAPKEMETRSSTIAAS